MIQSNIAPHGMVVTPHHLASESALAVLRDGGNAIEAMVSAAATIAVVYPHMNGLGGDGFWLIIPPNGNPISIDASGAAGSLANINLYKNEISIPHRGPKSAITVAGTISGWQEALILSNEISNNNLPISRLLRDAINYALNGIPITTSQFNATANKYHELKNQPGFAATFLSDGSIPKVGSRFIQPELANTLILMTKQGLDSFYRGEIANNIAREMNQIGIPIILKDLQHHRAQRCVPLHLSHSSGDIWNTTLPTQGLASLAILGIIDHLNMKKANELQTIHRIVEATKKSFLLRDKYITDPRYITVDLQKILDIKYLKSLASNINDTHAIPWETTEYGVGDTVWMGIIDNNGIAVSFIQSLYFEFGSGVVLIDSGITWQNRGSAFKLQPGHLLTLEPGKKPFHTLNPAAARLKDGRIIVYGSMGGDGQPQTQAAIFVRYVIQGMPLQQAINSPRWLLGKTWGASSSSLKIESRISKKTIQQLRKIGHCYIEQITDFSEIVGHAGAIVKHNNDMLEGAFDPRSNGSAAGF